MRRLTDKSEKDLVKTETEVKEWEIMENREASLRDQKHLEMAYEWLRNRGKTDLLKGAIESL
jgi:hypothetical protein